MHLHHSQGTNRAQAKMSRVFSEESSESSSDKDVDFIDIFVTGWRSCFAGLTWANFPVFLL